MANVEKKKSKLVARIQSLENELKAALQKKSAGKAIDVPKYTSEIKTLKAQLSAL